MSARPDPRAFAVHRATVRDGVDVAYVREGAGGYPLRAGARVAGDQADLVAQRRSAGGGRIRGDRARPAGLWRLRPRARGPLRHGRHARDVHALVHDVLGHERCAAAGGRLRGRGDPGPGAAVPGLRGAPVPVQHGAAALGGRVRGGGYRAGRAARVAQSADYFVRQGHDADGLAAELDTPEKRRRYIARLLRAPLLGRAGDLHGARRRLHDGAFRGRAIALRACFGHLRVGPGHARAVRAAALLRAQSGARRCCCTAPTTT